MDEKEQIQEIIKETAIRTVEAYRQTRQQERYNKTFKLLKQYRDGLFYLDNAGEERQKGKTAAAVLHVAAALDEIKRRRQQTGRENEYTALEMYFIQGHTYEEIETALAAGKGTPRRWITAAVQELTALLWGID